MKWAPPSIALAPVPQESGNLENELVDENAVAQEPLEDSSDEAAPAAVPFRLGPVPPINRTVVPTGVTDPKYPRGKFGNDLGRNWDSKCEQVVSIFFIILYFHMIDQLSISYQFLNLHSGRYGFRTISSFD